MKECVYCGNRTDDDYCHICQEYKGLVEIEEDEDE